MNRNNEKFSKRCFSLMKRLWWESPLPDSIKENGFYKIKGLVRGTSKGEMNLNSTVAYAKQVLAIQDYSNSFSIDFPQGPYFDLKKDDPKFIAFYLPQYYPDKHNEKWWGKGTTEWTNVSKAAAQYVGQYQPRLPGELGFYDLRVQDNIYRQIELARIHGVYGFCFYYYWFDGERLLDLPFDNFVNDSSIDFPFMISWVNANWTKQWNGNSDVPLIKQSPTIESYKEFIRSCTNLFLKENYITINGNPVLLIHKPSNVPSPKEVITYWKEWVKKEIGRDLYVMCSLTDHDDYEKDYLSLGFDAVSEFAPGPQLKDMKQINETKQFVCDEFYGKILDYKDFVVNKKYFKHNTSRMYRAACPMWDNTARKKNTGTILDGSTPDLFESWLIDLVKEMNSRTDLDDNFIFLNAWNEWAEGAYLEPDLKWKYSYLEAIKEAIMKSRN